MGELVSSDFCRRVRDTEIVHVDGRPYLLAAFPYQAFWLYDKRTMQDFIASDAFDNGHPPYAQDRVRGECCHWLRIRTLRGRLQIATSVAADYIPSGRSPVFRLSHTMQLRAARHTASGKSRNYPRQLSISSWHAPRIDLTKQSLGGRLARQSLVLDNPRRSAEQAVAQEGDLSQAFGKAGQHLEQRQRRPLGQCDPPLRTACRSSCTG